MSRESAAPRKDHGARDERKARTRGPARRFLNELTGLRHSDSRLYWLCRLTGRSFADYYAARMDRIAQSSPETATGRPEEKRFQLDYLVTQGLTPGSTLLDFGCGTGSAAVSFVGYLNGGNYVGADISASCLDVARGRMQNHQLQDRRPEFVHLAGGSLGCLGQRQFDFIWAQSVLTHMPPEDIGMLLRRLVSLMNPGSQFYATFAYTDGQPLQYRYKDWYYNQRFFEEVVQDLPLECSFMLDWQHPSSPIDRMVCFQRSSEPAAAAA